MNKLYRNLLLSRARATIAASHAVSEFNHPGLKGQLREIVVRDLLRPLLPSGIGIGSGQIISAYDQQQSRQEDIVLYEKRVSPPILFEEVYGVFPIESVLFVVEIKSILTSGELRKSHESANKLKELRLAKGLDTSPVVRANSRVESHKSCLLAFDSDLTQDGKSEIERYDDIRMGAIPAISSLCIINRGYWSWKNNQWEKWSTQKPAEELIHFVTDIMNNYQIIASTRLSPDFCEYVQD